jgi:hypothetical protein
MTFIFWGKGSHGVRAISEWSSKNYPTATYRSWHTITYEYKVNKVKKTKLGETEILFTKVIPPDSCVIIDDDGNLFDDLQYLDK